MRDLHFKATLPASSLGDKSYKDPQVPKSDQPKSPNDTYTLSAFSMMPKSMETLGQAGKFSSMNCFSWTVPYTSLPGASLEVSSGSRASFALMMVFTFHMNRPEFQ